jgi:hypothetical protein
MPTLNIPASGTEASVWLNGILTRGARSKESVDLATAPVAEGDQSGAYVSAIICWPSVQAPVHIPARLAGPEKKILGAFGSY